MVNQNYLTSPVITYNPAAAQFDAAEPFGQDESVSHMIRCGFGSPRGLSLPIPQQLMPVQQASRKRRADDADLDLDGSALQHLHAAADSSFSRPVAGARKVACVGSSSASLQEGGDPFVEQLRFHLGISWKSLTDNHLQASKGWARFIQNHYLIDSAAIVLFNDVWKAYFVRATSSEFNPPDQYFIFHESLMIGRHISDSLEGAVHRLMGMMQRQAADSRWSPFEEVGAVILHASQARRGSLSAARSAGF